MKTACTTSPIVRILGDELAAVSLIAESGYESLDFSLTGMVHDDNPWNGEDWQERAGRTREACARAGICVSQAHAPFTFRYTDPEEMSEKAIPRTLRSIEIASALGCPILVVQPLHELSYPRYGDMLYRRSLDYYRTLAETARRCNVKIALENMWQNDGKGRPARDMYADKEEFRRALGELNDPVFTACVDVGHTLLGRMCTAGEMIRHLGRDLVKCLHLHDVEDHRDTHTIPFLGLLDWEDICAALKEIRYEGDLCMEVGDNYYGRFTEPKMLLEALKFANTVGCFLRDKIRS